MTRSAWTHVLCDSCWMVRNGEKLPHRVIGQNEEPQEICCDCGKACPGIYIRENPAAMRCDGVHPEGA